MTRLPVLHEFPIAVVDEYYQVPLRPPGLDVRAKPGIYPRGVVFVDYAGRGVRGSANDGVMTV